METICSFHISKFSEWTHIPSEEKNNLEPANHFHALGGYNKISKAYIVNMIEHRDVSLMKFLLMVL